MKIADTHFKRALGLMFKKDGEMLFIFDKDVDYSVWTPFMNFSIDVFFLNEKLEVIDVKRSMDPWKVYKPSGAYRYFFESRDGKYSEKKVPDIVKKEIVKNNKGH